MELDLNLLRVFRAVAEGHNFREAGDRLGVTRSAVSQGIRRLEDSLGVALVQRSTRSVRLTEAGERLYREVAQPLTTLDAALETAHDDGPPRGLLRVTATSIAERFLSGPLLASFVQAHPGITLDVTVSDEEFDIVAAGFDAGVRLGEQLDRDMIALPIGPKLRMAAVASPGYWAQHTPPKTPRDLIDHRCINIRFPTHGGTYVWEFERAGREQNVRVDGQVIFNASHHIVAAAVAGLGVAYLPEDEFAPHIAEGRLIQVLKAWCPPFPGYHLYYLKRRQNSPAFKLAIEAVSKRRPLWVEAV